MPITTGLIVAGATGLIKAGEGYFQNKSAKADQAKNIRPTYQIPQEWYDNDNLAANMAQHGLTEPAMNYYTTQAQRGLSSGLGTVLQAGGGVNSIQDLYDSYDTGINKIATEDANLKNQNINNFIQANGNIANEKDKAFALNQYQPYIDRSKANAQKEIAGQQNMYSGIDDVAKDVTAYSNRSSTGDVTTDHPVYQQLDSPKSAGFGGIDMTAPGSKMALDQVLANNPNSPYLQNLLKQYQLN